MKNCIKTTGRLVPVRCDRTAYRVRAPEGRCVVRCAHQRPVRGAVRAPDAGAWCDAGARAPASRPTQPLWTGQIFFAFGRQTNFGDSKVAWCDAGVRAHRTGPTQPLWFGMRKPQKKFEPIFLALVDRKHFY